MPSNSSEPQLFQRNALAPALIAAAILFLAPLAMGKEWFNVVLYVASVFALIVAWFAFQAKQWWWIPVFLAIAVLWNPVLPFDFSGTLWTVAQPIAAVTFLVAGALIRTERTAA